MKSSSNVQKKGKKSKERYIFEALIEWLPVYCSFALEQNLAFFTQRRSLLKQLVFTDSFHFYQPCCQDTLLTSVNTHDNIQRKALPDAKELYYEEPFRLKHSLKLVAN